MTRVNGFTVFETGIGACGIAWGASGIVGVQLPEANGLKLRERLGRRFPGVCETPPPLPRPVQSAVDGIVALLDGMSSDLSQIELDMRGVPTFHQRVYEVARTIPPGTTVSYGDIAARLGEPAWPAARDVGQALGHNPFPIVVPCHRVVAAGGKLGGFSARGGLSTKRRLLSIEIAAFGTRSDEIATESEGRHSAVAFNAPLFADLQ